MPEPADQYSEETASAEAPAQPAPTATPFRDAEPTPSVEAGDRSPVDRDRPKPPLHLVPAPSGPLEEPDVDSSVPRETARRPNAPRPAVVDPEPANAPRARPRVITIANQKGGVGKTTSTVNLAAALAMDGKRVLVIDLDPQGNASTALGLAHSRGVPDVYQVLINGTSLDRVVRPVPDLPGLAGAPATIDLAGAEIELVPLVAREFRLRKALAAHLDAPTTAYDLVLIDCPPSLGLLTVNAMTAADEILIPIQCEYYALEGLQQLLQLVELVQANLNDSLRVSSILLTMYDGRTRLASQVADEVRRHFSERVLDTVIPRSVRVSEAPSYGQTVMTYDAASSGALAYRQAARELVAQLQRTEVSA